MGRGRVVLAMSGGVDSSVAAVLLQEQGYDVIGLFMRTGSSTIDAQHRTKTCCSAYDAIDARAVADRLDIPFFALDFEHDFGRIIDDFRSEYLRGRTPNPCVLCNLWLKFGKLWAYGQQVGAEFVATGHHARMVAEIDGTPRVARAVDRDKDQSYVLFGLPQAILPHVRLPVGEHTKAEIRAIARRRELPVHDKAESQEICFIPDNDYRTFVRSQKAQRNTAGEVVDTTGRVLAKHEGVEGYTIGQRRGLGVPTTGQPLYVLEIEPESRRVTVGPREALERDGLVASGFNWHSVRPGMGQRCLAQIRARHTAVAACVEPLTEDTVRVWFDHPQAAVAPGQVAALYDGDLLLGGGWIDCGLDRT